MGTTDEGNNPTCFIKSTFLNLEFLDNLSRNS